MIPFSSGSSASWHSGGHSYNTRGIRGGIWGGSEEVSGWGLWWQVLAQDGEETTAGETASFPGSLLKDKQENEARYERVVGEERNIHVSYIT